MPKPYESLCERAAEENAPGSEKNFDSKLPGTWPADLVERIQLTEFLIERLCGRPETGELIHGEHRMVKQVEVLRPKEQTRALGEMKLAAQGKVGLVDGESTEEVAREVALMAQRDRHKGSRV